MRMRSASRGASECAVVRLIAMISAAAMTLCAWRRFAQCMLGRLLLRLFFRRPLAARGQVADLHLDDEPLVVVRPHLADYAVLRQRHPPPLRQLLKPGLVFLKNKCLFDNRFQVWLKESF